jgi:hypothetical protein
MDTWIHEYKVYVYVGVNDERLINNIPKHRLIGYDQN